MAYRSLLSHKVKISFDDFNNFYADARAIGFSHNKSLNYAYNACIERRAENKKHYDDYVVK